jgi:hypothetical protein
MTFSILQARANAMASLVAFMPTAASPERPVIVVPGRPDDSPPETPPSGYVMVGNRVRILREPEPIVWGHISAIAEEPQLTESGVYHHGAEISFSQSTQFVPWLNLEQLK